LPESEEKKQQRRWRWNGLFRSYPPFLINGLRLDLLDDAETVKNDLNLEVVVRADVFLDARALQIRGGKNMAATRALNDGDG
jgi:hypothetical protein